MTDIKEDLLLGEKEKVGILIRDLSRLSNRTQKKMRRGRIILEEGGSGTGI